MLLESLHGYCSIAQFVRRYPVFAPAGDTERRKRRLHGCAKAKGLITFGTIHSELGDGVQFIGSLARYSMVLGSLTTYDGLDRASSKKIIVITATIRHPVTECIFLVQSRSDCARRRIFVCENESSVSGADSLLTCRLRRRYGHASFDPRV